MHEVIEPNTSADINLIYITCSTVKLSTLTGHFSVPPSSLSFLSFLNYLNQDQSSVKWILEHYKENAKPLTEIWFLVLNSSSTNEIGLHDCFAVVADRIEAPNSSPSMTNSTFFLSLVCCSVISGIFQNVLNSIL